MELAIHQVLKKLLLVIIGSGLISNALYIYGLAYYEGYIDRFGFEYGLFPIDWSDAPMWTYAASRELGVRTLNVWTTLSAGSTVIMILITVYMLARIWQSISVSEEKRTPAKKYWTYKLKKHLVQFKRLNPKLFKYFYYPFRWLLMTEQSLWAFVASYFFLIVLFFMPVFLFIWVYFPLIGISHGKAVATKIVEQYETTRCGNATDYWNQCITVSTGHVKGKGLPKTVEGRLILKNDKMIGMFTAYGPITMTLPDTYYQHTKKNSCYQKECDHN